MEGTKSGWDLEIPPDKAQRFQYRLRPYLGNAPDKELKARLDDILRNIYCFTPAAKLGPLPADRGGTLWMQKLVDLQLELWRRGIKLEGFVAFEKMPWNKKAIGLMRRNKALVPYMERNQIFCKYGEERWLQLAQREGRIRLWPASYFRGSHHNIARNADELVLRSYISPYDYDLGLIPDSMLRRLPPRGWGAIDHPKPSDHLLYCLTVGFDFRYFFDFGDWPDHAEACLVIHDQEALEHRLLRSARRQLPGWRIRFDAVRYIDPYNFSAMLSWTGDDIFFFKPFRYMYQGEYRLVAVPPAGTKNKLRYLDLELDPLTDISDLLLAV